MRDRTRLVGANHEDGIQTGGFRKKLLSALDSLQRRFSGALYTRVYDLFKTTDADRVGHPSLYAKFVEFERELVMARSLYGNNFYRIMGAWHSITIATILKKDDSISCPELLLAVRESLRESVPEFLHTNLYRLMTIVPTTREQTHQLTEITGMAKMMGHPIVNVKEGLTVVRVYACSHKETQFQTADVLEGEVTALFCAGWFREHGTWPPLQIRADCNQLLRSAITENRWPRPYEMRGIERQDFAALSIDACVEFDYHEDLLNIVGDSACCPDLSHWTQCFDKCGFRHLHGQRPPRIERQSRRVIQHYVTAEEGLAQKISNEVNHGFWDREFEVCLLSPKEGELKTESRLFCILEFRIKVLIGLLGHNVSKSVLKYLKSQTMTNSELEYLKKSYGYASEASSSSLKVLFFTLGFKKFNCQWRLHILISLCAFLDQIYGFNHVFMHLHILFSRMFVIMNSRTRPPKIGPDGYPEVGPYCHKLNEGGFEGLAQKVWTLAIQLLLLSFMRSHSVRGSLIGQGDNQILIARLSADQRSNVQLFATNLPSKLEVEFGPEGHNIPIKKAECWYSGHLIELNKELFLDGVHLSNGLKFASKITSDSNDTIGSFESKISGIATTCEAVGRTIDQPEIAYFLYNVEVTIACWRYKFLGDKISSYQAVPIWNTAIGGLPVSFLVNFILRGYPDRLTAQMSLLQYLRDNNPTLLSEVLRISPFQMSTSISPELLVLDPYSLNLQDSLSQRALLREHVRKVVRQLATNETVSRYMTIDARDQAKTLASTLLTMRPYNAAFAIEIYRCSDAGLASSFVATLDNTRTLVQLTQAAGEEDILEKVRSREKHYLDTIG